MKEPSTAASFVKRTSSILMPKGTRVIKNLLYFYLEKKN